MIEKFIPDGYELYVEPFVGAGALFFKLSHTKNVIADVHADLINFYQQIQVGNSDSIYELMAKHSNTEECYYEVRGRKPVSNIEKAFQFFYLRKTCFRGMLRYNKKGEFNIPFGRYKTFNYEILRNCEYQKLLSHTEIMEADFATVFDKYGNDENAFFFLDPPYDSVFTDYGYCKFDKEDHKRLHACFVAARAKCLMVIGETPFIAELYKDFIKARSDKKYAFKIYDGRVNEGSTHLIITNYA